MQVISQKAEHGEAFKNSEFCLVMSPCLTSLHRDADIALLDDGDRADLTFCDVSWLNMVEDVITGIYYYLKSHIRRTCSISKAKLCKMKLKKSGLNVTKLKI